MGAVILTSVIIGGILLILGMKWILDNIDDKYPVKAIEPKYDPEMVKFLAENGLSREQIITTMEQRNAIR